MKKVGASAKSVEWPNGSGGPQSNGVAQLVKQTKGGIGYAELAYALQNNLPLRDDEEPQREIRQGDRRVGCRRR